MPPIICFAGLYWLAASLIGTLAAVIDKRRAKHGAWRIPEATLLWIGALGGAEAMYVTMRAIHHKTLHKKFMIGLPLLMVLHAALIVAAVYLVWVQPIG